MQVATAVALDEEGLPISSVLSGVLQSLLFPPWCSWSWSGYGQAMMTEMPSNCLPFWVNSLNRLGWTNRKQII